MYTHKHTALSGVVCICVQRGRPFPIYATAAKATTGERIVNTCDVSPRVTGGKARFRCFQAGISLQLEKRDWIQSIPFP